MKEEDPYEKIYREDMERMLKNKKEQSKEQLEKEHFALLDYIAHHSYQVYLGNPPHSITDSIIELNNKLDNGNSEKFTFFYSSNSPFSQWYKCFFKGERIFDDSGKFKDEPQISFTSAEQYMMYHKAMINIEPEIAVKIMNTNDPRKQKEFGRSLKMEEHDLETWDFYKTEVVYNGNLAKFIQNEDLKQVLFSTKGTTLVEASPNDSIWSIGLAEDDPKAQKRKTWNGNNLLGIILTKIRIDLMGEY